MAQHNKLGRQGEEEAVGYLIRSGYHILARNWRFHRYEIDIMAERDGVLAVIEVKTRRNDYFTSPEESVSDAKIRHISICADAYIRMYKLDLPVRFDIISVLGTEPPFRIDHIENAFYPR